MRELSIFVDESGDASFSSRYYLLTLVFHDQANGIASHIASYQTALHDRGLPDIRFHATPLMRAQDSYAMVDERQRASLLNSFFFFVRNLPIAYKTFSFERGSVGEGGLDTAMRRSLVLFLFDHLNSFQPYDLIKVYYDDGQSVVTRALHGAIEYALSVDAVEYRRRGIAEYRLAQVADCICALELLGLKYDHGEQTKSDVMFFGTRRAFTRNYLRKIRKLAVE